MTHKIKLLERVILKCALDRGVDMRKLEIQLPDQDTGAPLFVSLGARSVSLHLDKNADRSEFEIAQLIMNRLAPEFEIDVRFVKLSQREGFKNRRAPVRRFFI